MCVESSALCYVDDYYYQKFLNEDKTDPKNTNFPIKMQALRVDWMMEDDGKKFLEEILLSDNDDLYESKTI